MRRDAADLKQDAINALGLRGLQRRRLIREAVRKGWIDDLATTKAGKSQRKQK